MLWSYSKLFFSLEKYTVSITLNVPTDIPNIYFKITVLCGMNHFIFLIKANKNDRFNLIGKGTGSFLFCKIQVLNTSWFLYSLAILLRRILYIYEFMQMGICMYIEKISYDCTHEIRRWLLLGRKVMTNLDGVLKSRRQRSV